MGGHGCVCGASDNMLAFIRFLISSLNNDIKYLLATVASVLECHSELVAYYLEASVLDLPLLNHNTSSQPFHLTLSLSLHGAHDMLYFKYTARERTEFVTQGGAVTQWGFSAQCKAIF
mgnify:CR=1 FL=1